MEVAEDEGHYRSKPRIARFVFIKYTNKFGAVGFSTKCITIYSSRSTRRLREHLPHHRGELRDGDVHHALVVPLVLNSVRNLGDAGAGCAVGTNEVLVH